ncbi:pyridoxamine 5'-phosphate oxidase [Paractinoplanes deccanensis]|uniref:Pyridoxamine 5'-phosphate oxidase n=1 Tax=Paractinoplanes deccanensis TaxID=113561 RepID=A0ABQ3XWJ3_9ACTN|nr:pyridoxamine 5'-phosphate oxidase family protein [Actinoplanes deccanensis]GID72081.1 pyridoxamine 5'-phosphate oxidase [Actinoplanes deccanensis]
MASWMEIEKDAPAFAQRVRALFDAGTNKTIATLRRDGSPRISATEAVFQDGELTFGSMPGAVKLLDLRRDPRMAMHAPTLEPPKDAPEKGPGDAKMAGVAVEIPPPADSPHTDAGFFRLDIREVVLTYVGTPADHLVIETWHAGRGHERRTRR